MEHYVAYHNEDNEGWQLGYGLNFRSKKGKTIFPGNFAWTINGKENSKRKKQYTLLGCYIIDNVYKDEEIKGRYIIEGESGIDFDPPIKLNELKWFSAFLKRQGNFGFGFNVVKNLEDIKNLESLKELVNQDSRQSFDDKKDIVFTEEVEAQNLYYEGATKIIAVNAYERNSVARQKCIDYFGILCCICGFNFEEVYGEIGKDFIHVHHLIPLSEIGKQYRLNPIKDLIPICPNCHAMLHKRKPPYSIKELKDKIKAIK